jgi:hypothetical protein
VTSPSRYFLLLAAIVISFLTPASADLKIKTRTTVMGHSTESTVYIKGPRERNEMSFGGRGGAVTITQCDQKRMITVSGNNCSVMQMGGGESSCPVTPNPRAMAHENAEPTPPRKGGVVTITRNVTDTGERQDMFGYKARHIKTSMMMESTPDACNQSHMKMETDGWYADLSAGFSCADESYKAMACGGMGGSRAQCNDRIVMKGSEAGGRAALGYPLKQTTTMMTDRGNFTTTTEVVELTNATLEDPLFDMPPGCKVTDMSAMAMAGAAPSQPATTPAPAATTPAPKPAAAPAPPPVAAKAAGVVRVGVVKIKDATDQGLPTDNMRLDLMDELTHKQLEVIPLEADSPQSAVEAEATTKQCDYILYTVATQVKDPNTGGLSPASLPKGATLDAAKYQALTAVTLYKVGKPAPELKDVPVAANGDQFAVNAVMATFPLESDKVAQQVDADAHPQAAKSAKPAAKKPAAATKPK